MYKQPRQNTNQKVDHNVYMDRTRHTCPIIKHYCTLQFLTIMCVVAIHKSWCAVTTLLNLLRPEQGYTIDIRTLISMGIHN